MFSSGIVALIATILIAAVVIGSVLTLVIVLSRSTSTRSRRGNIWWHHHPTHGWQKQTNGDDTQSRHSNQCSC